MSMTVPVRPTEGAADQPDAGPAASVAAARRDRAQAHRRPRHPRRFRVVGAGLVAIGVLLLVAAGLLALQVAEVATALRAAGPELGAVQAGVRAADPQASAEHVAALQEHAATASAVTGGPIWRTASTVPWLGDQLDAVTTVTRALDLVSTDVAPVLTDVAGAIDPVALGPVDGAVPLDPIVAAAPGLAGAAEAAADADALVRSIDTSRLVGPLAEEVERARGPLSEAADSLAVAATVAALVPPMLGAEGARHYLVLMLNPAELRSGGGIVGSVAVLRADDGALSFGEQIAARSLPRYEAPVLALADDELTVHSDQLGRVMQNVTMTPDFPRTAALAAEMWRLATGTSVDGVLALDPVTLSYVLGATGDVPAPDGTTLTAEGAVESLLLDAYVRYPDQDETDAFFAGAATGVFAAVTRGQGSPEAQVWALVRAAGEHRMALWSADPAEQGTLGSSALGGAFLTGPAEVVADQAGVFLDDTTGTKLGYFLDQHVGLTCTGDGAALTVDLASRVPDPAGLPAYVSGEGFSTVAPGVLRTRVTLYSPVGGTLGEIRSGDKVLGAARSVEAGREVAVLTETLEPGERSTIGVAVGAGGGPLGVWRTPGVTGSGQVAEVAC